MRLTMDAMVEKAQAAEAAGFVGMAGMDHLAPPLAERHDMYEALTTNVWLLAHTERLVQGQLVLCDAFRHPATGARGRHPRPRVRRTVRARDRLGLGDRGVHDVRRVADRGARARATA